MKAFLGFVLASLLAFPVYSQQQDTIRPSAVLQNSGTLGTGDRLCLPLGKGQASASIVVSGFGTAGVTVAVQGPGGFSPLSLIPVNVTSVGSTLTAVSTIIANGTYRADVASYSWVCAVLTSGTSQTITVQIEASVAPQVPGPGWTVIYTSGPVATSTTSPDIAVGNVKEIQVYQNGAAAPSGTITLNLRGTDGNYHPLLTAHTASTGDNGKMIYSLGPYANASEANAVTSMLVYTYTIPQILQLITPSNGTYIVYGR